MTSPNKPFNPDDVFDSILKQVKQGQKLKTGSKKKLYAALQQTFELGQYLLHTQTFQGFVELRDTKLWTKTAQKNPFHPLVQLAFASSNKATQSQYAKVLNHWNEQNLSSKELLDTLSALGVIELYNQANEAGKAKPLPDTYELDETQEKQWLFDQASTTIPLQELTPNAALAQVFDNDPLQHLLVRLENGKIKILGRPSPSQSQHTELVRQIIGSPPSRQHSQLVAKPFYELFKAADFFSRFSPDPNEQVTDDDWQGLGDKPFPAKLLAVSGLRLSHSGNEWRAQTVSQLPTFRSVDMPIADDLPELNKTKDYFLASAYCHILSDEFLYAGNWKMGKKNGTIVLKNKPRDISLPLPEFDPSASKRDYAILDTVRTIDLSFDLPKSRLRRLAQWQKEHKKSSYQNIPFPNLLQLESNDNQLALEFALSPHVCRIFGENAAPTNIAFSERFFLAKDLEALAKLTQDYQLDFTAEIFTTLELHSGIALTISQETGGNILIALPLAVSLVSDLGQIAKKV